MISAINIKWLEVFIELVTKDNRHQTPLEKGR